MTQSIILAAGEGSRLRPLTNEKPKCLVKFLDKTILDYQLNTLQKAGIYDINIVSGYQAKALKKLNLTHFTNKNYASTNMVESLFCALPFVSTDEDIIISYGDIIYQSDNLMKVMHADEDIAVMVDLKWLDIWKLRFNNPLNDAESMIIDSKGYIKELGKKTENYHNIQGQYTGLLKVKSSKISALIDFYNSLDQNKIYDGNVFKNMYLTHFLQLLIDSQWRVKSIPVNNGWLEFDSVNDLNLYEKLSKEGELKKIFSLLKI